ncbi:MAG: 2-oxoglutarate and iron-dependent oxygenase domain-containing protein [Actinomycetota bacterium]
MTFDAQAREAELVAQAVAWDTSQPVLAEPEDIPVVDIGPWRSSGNRADLDAAATILRDACERVGFFQLVGHGLGQDRIDDVFDWTRRFHDLPFEVKQTINIDNPGHPLGGVGYLPIGERRLPRRAKGNRNEAFLMKSDKTIAFDDNQWLPEAALPGFRDAVERYAGAAEATALELVTVYAVALDLEPDWFDEAMQEPFWRLRLTHYPPNEQVEGAHGIAPHVDTTFFTLLLQDGPGLVIYSAERDAWIQAPVVPGAIVVNTGELLRQWSNDRFLSTRHFADNAAPTSRYSIPLFFNASGDWPMECLPTCHGPDNPPRYATVSYNESQAVAQGE